MDLGEDWSNNEIIQAVAIGEFTNLDGIEWRNGAEKPCGRRFFRVPVRVSAWGKLQVREDVSGASRRAV